MIELVIKNYLDGHLDVPSFFEHQNGLKGKYVLVEKLSGGKRNMLNSSVFSAVSPHVCGPVVCAGLHSHRRRRQTPAHMAPAATRSCDGRASRQPRI